MTGISARNVLPARIVSMHDDGTTCRLDLALSGDEHLIATVARASTSELGLRAGGEVLAMVKAPWLTIAAGNGVRALSSPNQLVGEVTHIVTGKVNAELWLRTRGGNALVAVLPRDTVAECALKVGDTATAIISPSDVVIGVRGG